jgi:hypothetical protein
MPADFGLSRIKNESVTKISSMLGKLTDANVC